MQLLHSRLAIYTEIAAMSYLPNSDGVLGREKINSSVCGIKSLKFSFKKYYTGPEGPELEGEGSHLQVEA